VGVDLDMHLTSYALSKKYTNDRVSELTGLDLTEVNNKMADFDTQLKNTARIPIGQVFTAVSNQTVFYLSNTYEISSNSVAVEVDGVPQKVGEGFTESSTTSITLTESVPAGAIVKVTIFQTPTGVETKIGTFSNQLADIVISVKTLGAKGNGINDDTTAIQNTINSTPVGGVVFFPAGTYMISSILTLLPNRSYMGTGWGSTIKQMNGKNLAQMVNLGDETSQHPNIIIKDLQFDGNRDNNNNTVGLYLFALLNSMLYRVRVQNCAGTGFFFEGSANVRSSTNHMIDCWAFSNTGYGVYFSGAAEDNHIIGGDFGANWNSALYVAGVSSSVRSATLWGTQSGSGVIIAGVSNQVVGNNIEGHAGHGVELIASHNYVQGNKIYDNANVASAYGQRDGVYVGGASANVENCIIEGNDIYAGLYASTGYYRYAVNLDTFHINCEVNGNSIRYAKANGVLSKTNAINGLKDGDVYNGTIITTTANRPTSAPLSQKAFDITLGKPIYYNGTVWKDSAGTTV
jgi:hypothetical protein